MIPRSSGIHIYIYITFLMTVISLIPKGMNLPGHLYDDLKSKLRDMNFRAAEDEGREKGPYPTL